MRIRDLGTGAISCAAAAVIAIACSAGGDDIDEPLPIQPVDAGAEHMFPPPEAGPDGECKTACSGDLHHVVDCRGTVLKTCSDDKGCADGDCVPACEAAERNQSTSGCEYYSVDPAEYGDAAGSCFAAFVVNTWNTDVSIGVEYRGETFDATKVARIPVGTGLSIAYEPLPNGKLPPGKVAILFLAHYKTPYTKFCPEGVTPLVTEFDAKLTGTGITDAFHIVVDRPVNAYDMYPYGAGNTAITSATLLVPTSAWGTNYMAQSPFTPYAAAASDMQPFVEIVAKQDGTKVTIKPTVDIIGNSSVGVAPGSKGVATTYSLNRGQVLQLSQTTELAGSIIESDRPVGVWGGQNCFWVDQEYCDSAHQQIPAISMFGHEYVAVRHGDRLWYRDENPAWRIVAVNDETTLTYEPERPAGAPLTLKQGEIATFHEPKPFVVRSQDSDHPFYMSAHMSGGSGYVGRGDAEWVNVVPPAQFLNQYVFFTDPTYPETSLVVIRDRTDGDFEDVELDCSGAITDWEQVDSKDHYEYARVTLVSGAFEPQNGCDNGLHAMRSKKPFSVTVWGWGNNAVPGYTSGNNSYAFPGGAGVRQVNTVVVRPAQ